MLLLAQPILDKERPESPNHTLAHLAIIWVGHNSDSEIYVKKKQVESTSYGIETQIYHFDDTVDPQILKDKIHDLNQDDTVDAIIVQLPLPKPFNRDEILEYIAPEKDVDDLTQKSPFTSPMVLGIQALISEYDLKLNEPLCVIGSGPLVGRPVRKWLESIGQEPIIINKQTPLADALIQSGNVLFCGAGSQVITEKDVNSNQIIFDCSGRDVDFEVVKDKVKAITPPTGSIGPLTMHFLFINTLKAGSKRI